MTLSWSALAAVGLVLAGAAFWYDSMQVREAANRLAADICRRRGLQFLDGTVALTALRPRLTHRGLRLERTYLFDYTEDGVGRLNGFIIMRGRALETVGLSGGERAH